MGENMDRPSSPGANASSVPPTPNKAVAACLRATRCCWQMRNSDAALRSQTEDLHARKRFECPHIAPCRLRSERPGGRCRYVLIANETEFAGLSGQACD